MVLSLLVLGSAYVADMARLLVVLGSALVLAAVTARLAIVVRGDGWGHRPPPGACVGWDAGPSLTGREDVR